MLRPNIVLLALFLCFLSCTTEKKVKQEIIPDVAIPSKTKPKVSFTFDDGSVSDRAGMDVKEWNEMILSHLEKKSLKAILFATGRNLSSTKGKYVLKSWNDAGHFIANHTFTHPSFNIAENSSKTFEEELLKNDKVISSYEQSLKFFRFPYLKEGESPEKVQAIREVLEKNGYTNGYVTIDASDWFVDQRLRERIKSTGMLAEEVDKYRDYFLEHIMERANFYEEMAYELHGRHIQHTLLLHHNLTSALFLGDLIERFEEEGWEVTHANQAYEDPIFDKIPSVEFAGESLIYAQAKESGKFDELLRYPAEDSQYEKEKMNKLGL